MIEFVNDVQASTCHVGIGAELRGPCAICDVVHLLQRYGEAWWSESRMDRVAVGAVWGRTRGSPRAVRFVVATSVGCAALKDRQVVSAVVFRPTLPGHARALEGRVFMHASVFRAYLESD